MSLLPSRSSFCAVKPACRHFMTAQLGNTSLRLLQPMECCLIYALEQLTRLSEVWSSERVSFLPPIVFRTSLARTPPLLACILHVAGLGFRVTATAPWNFCWRGSTLLRSRLRSFCNSFLRSSYLFTQCLKLRHVGRQHSKHGLDRIEHAGAQKHWLCIACFGRFWNCVLGLAVYLQPLLQPTLQVPRTIPLQDLPYICDTRSSPRPLAF